MRARTEKVEWSGEVVSVQPRIRLLRSFDERTHSYLGYVLGIEGRCGEQTGAFAVAIGKGAQAKHQFRVGMRVSGVAVAVPDPRMETAGYYKASRLNLLAGPEPQITPPPFHGTPPELTTFRSRGHRRLATQTYKGQCSTCQWGCLMPVEMIIDHWNPSKRRYRFESFCYGPLSCPLYRPGPNRKVPGRKGMSYTEEDWVDEEETSHRGPDE